MFWNGRTAIDGLSGSGSAVGGGRWHRRYRRAGLPAPNLNRPSNVLECLRAAVVERGIETVAHILMHAARYANPSRRRDLLQTGSDVDAVAEDVVAVDDDVAEVDADTEGNAPVLSYLSGAVGHRRLHLDRAAHGIDHARELQQQAVARGLDDATAVAGDCRIHDFLTKGFQRCQCAALVPSHQPRVARDVGGHDGGKAALLGHSGSPATRKASRYFRVLEADKWGGL